MLDSELADKVVTGLADPQDVIQLPPDRQLEPYKQQETCQQTGHLQVPHNGDRPGAKQAGNYFAPWSRETQGNVYWSLVKEGREQSGKAEQRAPTTRAVTQERRERKKMSQATHVPDM